jgi:small-conductance mechanosensitive channel
VPLLVHDVYPTFSGDEIRFNGISGTVERIGHAMTTVRSGDGRVFLVPNSQFLEHVVEKRASTPEDS